MEAGRKTKSDGRGTRAFILSQSVQSPQRKTTVFFSGLAGKKENLSDLCLPRSSPWNYRGWPPDGTGVSSV